MNSARHLALMACLATGVAVFSAGAQAAPIGQPLAMATDGPTSAQPVYWRGWGWGWGAPFVAGAVIGGAIAAPYYYGYGPGPYYRAYGPPPGYYGAAPPPPNEADESYCMQRFKSYDPNTGTYRGTDGRRHPCP